MGIIKSNITSTTVKRIPRRKPNTDRSGRAAERREARRALAAERRAAKREGIKDGHSIVNKRKKK